MSLPNGARALEKAERMTSERTALSSGEARDSVVKTLERLYVEALKDRRPVDAEFYRKTLVSLYPDWKFKAGND
jgi:hypothetical protein